MSLKTLPKRAAQKGFTLIEILVALAILSMIAMLAANAFDGSRTKAQAMLALGKQIGDANIQLKNDTGCFVNKPQALFDETAAAQAANNYCNRSFGRTWARPYLGQYSVDAAGAIKADKISAEVTASLQRLNEGTRTVYFIRFGNVPKDIMKQALLECNNTDESGGDFRANRCRTESDLGTDEPGTFDMMYATTR